jgi:hypothetical protein
MSVDKSHDSTDTADTERREAEGDRVPFEGVVEVGGALGPSFEAHAIDVSKEGIHLRTAYLPELGQPLTCRIEVNGDVVLAAGEVVWRHEEGKGGDFGMRFTELDAASEAALRRLVTVEPVFAAEAEGTRVRLHIDGLGSPMRARIRGSAAEGLVVGSELGFLQVGKELELEDARTGGKRGARIHRVGVEINPETQIPQLVVSLRYDVTDADVPVEATASPRGEDTPEPSVIDDEQPRATIPGTGETVGASRPRHARALVDEGGVEEDADFAPMRSGVGEALHKASAKIVPAVGKLGAQAMTALQILAARAKKAASRAEREDHSPATRRTTAPAPTGGLHATGRKVVRGDRASVLEIPVDVPSGTTKRRVAVGSAVLVAGVLAFAAVHRPAASSDKSASVDPNTASSTPAALGAPPPAASTMSPPVASSAPVPPAPPAVAPAGTDDGPIAPSTVANDEPHGHRRPTHVTPFGNGPVGHANVLRLKMDGSIEKIEGATTPTGFNVVIPDRRSLEAAAPLASRDGRIAAIRVTNEASGAELAVSFKDGVPNYQVRARGDSLEILLAPQGKLADGDDTKTTKHKHVKH